MHASKSLKSVLWGPWLEKASVKPVLEVPEAVSRVKKELMFNHLENFKAGVSTAEKTLHDLEVAFDQLKTTEKKWWSDYHQNKATGKLALQLFQWWRSIEALSSRRHLNDSMVYKKECKGFWETFNQYIEKWVPQYLENVSDPGPDSSPKNLKRGLLLWVRASALYAELEMNALDGANGENIWGSEAKKFLLAMDKGNGLEVLSNRQLKSYVAEHAHPLFLKTLGKFAQVFEPNERSAQLFDIVSPWIQKLRGNFSELPWLVWFSAWLEKPERDKVIEVISENEDTLRFFGSSILDHEKTSLAANVLHESLERHVIHRIRRVILGGQKYHSSLSTMPEDKFGFFAVLDGVRRSIFSTPQASLNLSQTCFHELCEHDEFKGLIEKNLQNPKVFFKSLWLLNSFFRFNHDFLEPWKENPEEAKKWCWEWLKEAEIKPLTNKVLLQSEPMWIQFFRMDQKTQQSFFEWFDAVDPSWVFAMSRALEDSIQSCGSQASSGAKNYATEEEDRIRKSALGLFQHLVAHDPSWLRKSFGGKSPSIWSLLSLSFTDQEKSECIKKMLELDVAVSVSDSRVPRRL